MVILDAWEKKMGLLKGKGFFVEFQGTRFGETLKIVAPVVSYEEDALKPRWLSSLRPYVSDQEVRLREEE